MPQQNERALASIWHYLPSLQPTTFCHTTVARVFASVNRFMQRFRIQEQQQFGGDGSGENFLNTRKGERIPGFNQDEGTEKVAFGTRGGQGPANGTLTGNGKAGGREMSGWKFRVSCWPG